MRTPVPAQDMTSRLDMNKDVAREIIRAAFRSGSELEGLIGVLKGRCAPDDYKFFLRQIAMAIDGIHTALVNEAV